MKWLYFLIICLGGRAVANAQDYLWTPDSLSASSPNFAMNKYNQLLNYQDQLMYVAFPVIHPISSRIIPLKNGEGENGYWLEGNFAYRFVIHKGKYYNPAWLQRLRFTFDAALTPRLTRDESSPLLPSNNKFGVGMDLLVSSLPALLRSRVTPAWITVQMLHYSNGQADSFFIEEDGLKRNNYRSGDFSTNSLRLIFNVANISANENVVAAGVGFQREIDLQGSFGLSPALDKSYGKNRLLFSFQWLRASRLVTRNLVFKSSTEKVTKRRHFSLRTELEYIVGDLSNFQLERKYRLGWHTYLTYMPSLTNEVGFLIHTYAGRDYLNIRFDDIVFIGQAGLYMRINKK
jgi:hypothetical protein